MDLVNIALSKPEVGGEGARRGAKVGAGAGTAVVVVVVVVAAVEVMVVDDIAARGKATNSVE